MGRLHRKDPHFKGARQLTPTKMAENRPPNTENGKGRFGVFGPQESLPVLLVVSTPLGSYEVSVIVEHVE